jgi:hypothetical protein
MSSSTSEIQEDPAKTSDDTNISHSKELVDQLSVSEMQPSSFHAYRLPPIIFSEDEDASDTDSFDIEDLMGSDPDAIIIGRLPPMQESSSSHDAGFSERNTAVCSSPLIQRYPFLHRKLGY